MSSIIEARRRARQQQETPSLGPAPGMGLGRKPPRRPRFRAPLFLAVVLCLAVGAAWLIRSSVSRQTPSTEKSDVRYVPKKTPAAQPRPPAPAWPGQLQPQTRMAPNPAQPEGQNATPAPIMAPPAPPAAPPAPGPPPPQASAPLPPSETPPPYTRPMPPRPLARTNVPDRSLPYAQNRPSESEGREASPSTATRSEASSNEAVSPSRMQALPSQTVPTDNRSAREHFEAGKLAQDQGRPSQAMIEYRKALRLDPTLSRAYLNMGNIFFATYEDQERAREMYQQALKFDPESKLGHNNLGVIYLKQDRLDQAEAEFRAATKKDPNYADALYNLACIYAKKGQPEQALAQLKKAARIEPGVGRSAASDPDLVSLRGLPDFERLLKTSSPKTEKD